MLISEKKKNNIFKYFEDGIQQDAAEILQGILLFDSRLKNKLSFNQIISNVCMYNNIPIDDNAFPQKPPKCEESNILFVESQILRTSKFIPQDILMYNETLERNIAGCHVPHDPSEVDETLLRDEKNNMFLRNQYMMGIKDKKNVSCERQVYTTQTRDFICVQLKRFDFQRRKNDGSFTMKKIKSKEFNVNIQSNFQLEGKEYEICGIIFHSGQNTNSGHYISHIHTNGNWYVVDDESVTKLNDNANPFLMYGERAEKPYILLYKNKSTPIFEYIPKGLNNIGNSCYFNSALQLLLLIKATMQ